MKFNLIHKKKLCSENTLPIMASIIAIRTRSVVLSIVKVDPKIATPCY